MKVNQQIQISMRVKWVSNILCVFYYFDVYFNIIISQVSHLIIPIIRYSHQWKKFKKHKYVGMWDNGCQTLYVVGVFYYFDSTISP